MQKECFRSKKNKNNNNQYFKTHNETGSVAFLNFGKRFERMMVTDRKPRTDYI